MRATSDNQHSASISKQLPEFEEVRDGMWALAQPFPSVLEAYTLSYLLRDSSGDIHIIDPGADVDANWKRLEGALARIGASANDVASTTVTHMHFDHLGMAARLSEASGATIAVHAIEQRAIDAGGRPEWTSAESLDSWGVPAAVVGELLVLSTHAPPAPEVAADLLLQDGDVLAIPGREVRVIHTPGHTTGHICLHATDERLMFMGDHVLPSQFSGIGLGASTPNPIRDYRNSLDAVAAYDVEACPGHGYRFDGLADRCLTIAAHHARRTTEVAAVLAVQPNATVWQIASQLTWTAGWKNLSGFYLASALAQSAMHADFVRQD